MDTGKAISAENVNTFLLHGFIVRVRPATEKELAWRAGRRPSTLIDRDAPTCVYSIVFREKA